ncbi:hypothetical protein CBR_g44283 [Chara braunii]|uniref:Reverse transcriptase/retrotransposon-derived protein RNase H-like domain-containing protein n=1 Tax=Chara braunii TaxID=69332 RepID=A0A388K314_CHABU|nr:hypothetical protein CBR_g44283 [Chara braunii]|eukprot:GBG64399.1 hypothetical protein CBR_g44283 [Chara braunii]
MDGVAGRHDNVDDGRNDIQELAWVIRQSQRELYPKIDVPLFNGNHASSWADKFEQLGYSNEWTDEKMLRMVKSDRLLDLRDLRAVDRKKFGTTKQFLPEFERVARLIPDLSDKDRCLIFLDNFNDVEQSKLVEGMQGRYDWTKARQNALVGKFDDILYRLLRQQKEEREKVKLGEVKDGEIYKTLTCMREMMEGMKEERLKLQAMLAKEKNSKRKGKEPAEEESDSESEEEKEPPRKLTKAERKVLNQIQGRQGTSRKQGKNGGQNNRGGDGGVGGGLSRQCSQDQGQFQPQGGRGRGRGRGNGQRNRWAWQQEATCNYCAEKGHIMWFCQLLSRDEKEEIVFTTIRGQVFDYEGNLIDPNIEGGIRKEAFRRIGRPLPATFRIASPEEARLAGVEEAMASLHIDDSLTEPGGANHHETACPIPGLYYLTLRGHRGSLVGTRMRRQNEQLQKERESEKAVEEEPIPVSENDEDNADERLWAEEEEQACRRALEREPEKGKAEASEEASRKKKNIYSIPVEQGVEIERLVDKILERQRDLVTLREILAVLPKIREEFKQRMTRKRVMTVKLGEVIPLEANWSPPGTKMDWRSVSTGHMKVQIGQQEYSTLVDDGAEMNIIRERHAIEAESDQAEESFPVDAFLKEEESRLSINSLTYLTDAATRRGRSIWNAHTCHEVRSELVVEGPFIEEDPWGEQTAEEMMRLALTDDIDLMLDPLTIEQGHMQADVAFQTVRRMSYIMNLLVHEDRLRLMNAEKGSMALEKSEFFLSEISFLGYIVTVDGLKPDPRKVAAVQEAPAPVTLTQVRPFLGLASYYRRFIKGFAGVAKPLTNMLKKEEQLIGTPECEAAFQALKEALTSAPVLARPNLTRPFALYTDWQPQAISTVLTQHGADGREHVIEYASKTLSQAQANYEACEGECLAVVCGIQHFRLYLYGQKLVLGPYPMHEFSEYLVELTDVEPLPFADEDAWELHRALYKSVALGMFRFFVDHEDHYIGEHFVVYYVIKWPKPAQKEGTVALYPFAQLHTIDPGLLELIHLELLSIAQVIGSEEEEIQPRLRTATAPWRTYNEVVIPDYIAQRAERLEDFPEEKPLRPPSSYPRPESPKAPKKTPKRKKRHPSPGAQGSRINGGEEVIQPARARNLDPAPRSEATLVKETVVPSPPFPRVPDLNLDGVGPSAAAAAGGGSRMGLPNPISRPPVLAGPLHFRQPPRGAPIIDISSSSEPDGPSERGGFHGGAHHHQARGHRGGAAP